MHAEVNVSPKNPLSFQIRAAAKSLRPLLRSGALAMTPAQAPAILSYLHRWKLSVGAILHMGALRYPDRLALVDDLGELTYRQLRDDSVNLARAMMDRGMGPGTAFAVIARNGRGIIEPMAIKALIGSEIMLLNIGASPNQIEGIVEQNDVRFLFLDEEFLPQLPEELPGVQLVITHLEDPADRSGLPAGALVMSDLVAAGGTTPLAHKPEQGRIIIMSSGTTGLPKGILRDEPRTPATLGAITDRIPWRRNMVVHQAASMFHAWGWANVIIGLVTGATIITQRVYDARRCLDQCERYGVNGLVSAAIWLKYLKEALDEDPDRRVGPFEFIISSGNAIPGWLVTELTARFGPVVCNFYGSTEAGLTAIASGEELARMPDTAGRPAIGVRLALLDDEGRPVGPGEVGRVHTTQELTFKGYLSPKDTWRTVDGMFEIGDLATMDENGYLYVCGRSDDMIIRGGENVFPREVDELLGPLPGVGDVYAHGVNDDDLVAQMHLYVVRAEDPAGAALTGEYLQEYVRRHLASWSVPDRVFFVDHLPRNAAGKVVPRSLEALERVEA
ncbi:AMP-binding protein [Corynebacterium sphenisci]|uniref:AMP-binding protein n=1 Tax=Corynebacterium sphenisci TaxID=191493 RepID=UPI0026DF5638|nr:AMP-binding protein [Corynebacterium sphenisci]MDO5730988.1 AMP-binding protein [Corynebacterium sphenisci]